MIDDRTADVIIVVAPRGATDAADRAFLVAAAGWALRVVPGTLSLDRHCPTCGGNDHGRPLVRRAEGPSRTGHRLQVSLSRAGSAVAVALSFSGAVGIDIESIDAVARAGFDDVAFTPAERGALGELGTRAEPAGLTAFGDPGAAPVGTAPVGTAPVGAAPVASAVRARAALWTGKEATLKAIGLGLRVDPTTLTVSLPRPGSEGRPTVSAEPRDGLPRPLPRLAGFDAGPGLVGTIAVFSAAEPVVRVLAAGRIPGLSTP